MLDFILFLSCLEFAIRNSTYFNTILKPKEVICLEHLYLKRDVICVLPTRYGKSLMFHLLPGLLFAKEMLLMNETFRDVDMLTVTAIVIVVSPLNALINNQIFHLGSSGIRASVLGVKKFRMKNSIPLTVTFDFATRKNCAQVIIILYLHIRSLYLL